MLLEKIIASRNAERRISVTDGRGYPCKESSSCPSTRLQIRNILLRIVIACSEELDMLVTKVIARRTQEVSETHLENKAGSEPFQMTRTVWATENRALIRAGAEGCGVSMWGPLGNYMATIRCSYRKKWTRNRTQNSMKINSRCIGKMQTLNTLEENMDYVHNLE